VDEFPSDELVIRLQKASGDDERASILFRDIVGSLPDELSRSLSVCGVCFTLTLSFSVTVDNSGQRFQFPNFLS